LERLKTLKPITPLPTKTAPAKKGNPAATRSSKLEDHKKTNENNMPKTPEPRLKTQRAKGSHLKILFPIKNTEE
jgi:hypothetical protein